MSDKFGDPLHVWQGEAKVDLVELSDADSWDMMSDLVERLSEMLFNPDECDDRYAIIDVDELREAITEIKRLRNYERECEEAAAIVQSVHPIGQVKAIGLREVAAGVQWMKEEIERLKAA